jgi:mRNA interferase MazF
MQRGDIVICVLVGDYGKFRPAVIIQSDLFNSTHASLVVCPVTSHLINAPLFRIAIKPTASNGITNDSQIMVDKLMAIKREKVTKKIGVLSQEDIRELDEAIMLWLGLQSASD